ncbi:hypothetical protein EC912_101726 [Luteibacter rhizovicinus]|uniref:Uncharacterized protein n=1 Tax=Luteibacter rhizovicinus TaxID=242606 RepID=A0A4V2W4Y6_9GAMM|nr:hypothetical protein EC912_101726 [Luteibacter rhizovicinus]
MSATNWLTPNRHAVLANLAVRGVEQGVLTARNECIVGC